MKKRIFLGLAPLFILLIGMGFYAVLLFTKLGNRVDIILRENLRSVIAGQQMKESAERMQSAFFLSISGEEKQGRELYKLSLPAFREGLRKELGNITLPGEAEFAQKIKRAHDSYAAEADQFWATPDRETRRRMLLDVMQPLFIEVKDTAQQIIRINQDSMVQADRDARALAFKSTRLMVLAILTGVVGSLIFTVRLQRAIVRPIQDLTAVSKELGEGKLDQVVPVHSQDELGQLADTFNKMATRLRAYRQAMGDQVLQARQMTEITFSAFPDPIIALSSDNRIDFTNPAASRFLSSCGLSGGLPASVQTEVDRIFHGAPDFLPMSFEQVLVFRVNDQEICMLPRVIGIRDDMGRIFGAAVILQDVTRLRLLDEVKTNLVSTVSHELKTPLTSVRMGLHLLLEERIGPLNAKQTELVLAAREDSERLLRMINDLLDLAKLESGTARSMRRTIPAGHLLESARDDLHALVEARGSRIRLEIAPGLPAVSVDEAQMAHVFSNFVANAVKHTPAGEEIILRAAQGNGSVRFSVIDHGAGIPERFQSQIFDRFFRVPGAEVTGAGLGLAIAKEVALSQGGSIGLKSAPGVGSEFYVDLPAVKSEELT